MPRIHAVVFVVFALSLGAASTVLAQSQTSADASCPAARPPVQIYAGLSKPASYSIPDPSNPDNTITVINLSRKSCIQSCASEGGGNIVGMCYAQDDCKTTTQCNRQPVQEATPSGTNSSTISPAGTIGNPAGDYVPGATTPSVPTATDQGQTETQTPAAQQPSFPSVNSSVPTVSIPASWLQQGGTLQSSISPDQSLFNQALGSLEGNPSDNSTESNTSVPTTPEEYLQSTFGTSPNGALEGSTITTPGASVSQNGTLVYQNPDGSLTVERPSSMNASDWLQQVNTLSQGLANGGCQTSGCVVINTGDRAIVYQGGATLPGTYLVQSNGPLATDIWSTVAGVNPQTISDSLQTGVQVTTPNGTVVLQASPYLADSAGNAMANDYNSSSLYDRVNAYFNGTPGYTVSYMSPSSEVPQVIASPSTSYGPAFNEALGSIPSTNYGPVQVDAFGSLDTTNYGGTPVDALGYLDLPTSPNSQNTEFTPDMTISATDFAKLFPNGVAPPIPQPAETPQEPQSPTQIVQSEFNQLPQTPVVPSTPPTTESPAEQSPSPTPNPNPTPNPTPNSAQPAPSPQPSPSPAPNPSPTPTPTPSPTPAPQPQLASNVQPTLIQQLLCGILGLFGSGCSASSQPSPAPATTPSPPQTTQPTQIASNGLPPANQPSGTNGSQPNKSNGSGGSGSSGSSGTGNSAATSLGTSNSQNNPNSNSSIPFTVASIPATKGSSGAGGSGSNQASTIPFKLVVLTSAQGTQSAPSGSSNAQPGTNPNAGGTAGTPGLQTGGQAAGNTGTNPNNGTTKGAPNQAQTAPGQTGQTGSKGAPADTTNQNSPNPSNTPNTQSVTQPNPNGQGGGTGGSGNGNGTGTGNGNGSEAGVQGSGSSATNCQTISCWAQQQLNNVKKALQSPGKALADLFSVGSANAAPNQQFTPQDAAKAFEKGFRTFVATAVDRTQQTSKRTVFDIENGVGAAGYLSNKVEGSLKGQLQSYVKDALALKQAFNTCVPATQSPDETLSMGQKFCLGGAKIAGTETSLQDAAGNLAAKGAGLVADVKKYVNSNPTPPPPNPSASIGPIGSPAPAPQSTGGQPTGSGETPAPAPAQPAPPPVVAKSAPFTGAASVYDCRLGGINGNCAQSATGGLGVNPSEYSAALQVGYAKVFQVGYGQGAVGYALVENLDTGRQMIVKVNDNGPLTPGRIIDLSPASMNCLAYGTCNNDSTLHSTVLPSVKVTLLQGNYTPGLIANGVLPTSAPCNYRGCATPTPNPQVAAARTPGLTSAANCSGASTLCASDPTTGAAFTCQGDQATCLAGLQQQLALSRLCASNPATCTANAGSYNEKSNGTATPPPEPRKTISMPNTYGTTGKLAKNPNVPTTSGISSQDLIGKLRAAGVPVQDMSSASLTGYPHGKNQMTALTWHGDGSSGNGAGLVQEEIGQNNAGAPAAQAVLQQDGTLVVVAPLDAVSFHAATMNALGPGIEIQGMNNTGANPTPAQTATMQKITSVVMDQLGWEVATHGQIEPGHKDALEAGPATIAYVYQGIAPAPVPSYTLVDAQGNPVLDPNGNPITTTQAPGSDNTGQFLVGPDGQPLLDSSGKPIPVPPVQVTQSLSNPNVYTAPDDRPQQPAPVNPWAGQAGYPNAQYAPVATAQPVRYASLQPPSQAYPQPIQQPLPYPASASSNQQNPMVNIVANPRSVASGKTSTITWNSLGTTQCNVVSSTGTTLSSTSTKGTIVSPQLSATTVFTAFCQAQITTTVGVANTTISASTSVTVQ